VESIEGDSSDSSSILGHTVTLALITGGSTSRGTRGEMLRWTALLRVDQPRPDITRNKGVRPELLARVGQSVNVKDVLAQNASINRGRTSPGTRVCGQS